MKSTFFVACFAAAVMAVAIASRSIAAGAVIVRIDDGAGETVRCINPTEDRVWLTLRRMIVKKSKSWLSRDRSVAVLLNATLTTDPAGPKALSFPLASEVTLGEYGSGQVSVPVEYIVVSGLTLREAAALYSGLSLEVTLLNKRQRAGFGSALQALVDVSSKLPIPSNPATTTATYLLDYANAAVAKGIDEHNDNDKLKSAVLALLFASDGDCTGPGRDGFESAGTKIVLQSEGVAGPGLIEVNATNEYCWIAETSPAFVVKAARRMPGVDCTSPQYHPRYVQVTNNYTGFYLNAVAATGVLGAEDRAERDREESLRRCSLHGVPQEECL